MEYRTIKDNNMSEIIEKKSRFIAQVYYINNKIEAEEIIKKVKKEYYDAKHNCYCYNFYDEVSGKIINKFSDDGEPSGTAGVPINSVITGKKLVNVLVIVTRYFGGILLGTGGLVRAYKQVTENVIEKSILYSFVQGYEVKINLDYNNIDMFKYYCKNNNITILNVEYSEKIKCTFEISVEDFTEQNPYYDKKDIVRQKPIISEFE